VIAVIAAVAATAVASTAATAERDATSSDPFSTLFYRAGDGLAATGYVDVDGAFVGQQVVGGFVAVFVCTSWGGAFAPK